MSNFNLGLYLNAAVHFAEAEGVFRRALELAPQMSLTRSNLALALHAQGRGEEALEAVIREPEESARRWALAIVHHGMGHAAESDEALRELIEKHAESSAALIAEVYGVRGEVDAAFEWLGRAHAGGDLAEIRSSPRLRLLHGDPRWAALLKKMGFQD